MKYTDSFLMKPYIRMETIFAQSDFSPIQQPNVSIYAKELWLNTNFFSFVFKNHAEWFCQLIFYLKFWFFMWIIDKTKSKTDR